MVLSVHVGSYWARMYGFRWYGSGVYALREYVLPVHVDSIRIPPRVLRPGGPAVYGCGVYLICVSVVVLL